MQKVLLKKKELEEEHDKPDKAINSLVLIQSPNDDSKLKDAGHKTKEKIVLDYQEGTPTFP